MEKVSVFLAERQVLFREGIHFTLSGEEDIEVIGESTDNQEALNLIEGNPPKVAVVNANHDQMSGVKLARRLRQDLPSVSVVLILDRDDEDLLFAALKSGARAAMTKDAEPGELVETIRAVARGRNLIALLLLRQRLAARALADFETPSLANKQLASLTAHLSPREAEIVRRISGGASAELVQAQFELEEPALHQQLEGVVTKLIANDHIRAILEAAGRKPEPAAAPGQRPESPYVTRDELDAFKQSLLERFRTMITDLTEHRRKE